MSETNNEYSGPRAQTVGHRRYDALLKEVIRAVRDNMSREDLLTLFLDGLASISPARSIAVVEVVHFEDDTGNVRSAVRGYDQRGIHPDRWRHFRENGYDLIPKDSLIHRVIEEGLSMDVWGSAYFPNEFEAFRQLFDVGKGGWIAGIQLPRATERHNHQGIFLWYTTGRGIDRLPGGVEQDWRLLGLFQHCYDMAGYHIRKVARKIIQQRQELLRMLTPSILNHEINARIDFFTKGLEFTREDLESWLSMDGQGEAERQSELVRSVLKRIEEQLLPHAMRLSAVSESVMGLTRRIASGPTDPVREIRSALELVGHSATAASVSVELASVPKDSIEIVTDPALLMHILVNLLKNAVEALETVKLNSLEHMKRVWIDVTWLGDEQVGLPLCIHICDNGPGVAPDLATRLFEAGITSKRGGHGLGLAICKMIAEYLGGNLDLKHERNPTTFLLRLPQGSPKVADLEEELKSEVEG